MKNELIGLGALGILGYVAYNIVNNEQQQITPYTDNGYMLIQRTQGAPTSTTTKKEQTPITYNIKFEAPKLPSNITLKQQQEGIKKENKTKKEHKTTRRRRHSRRDIYKVVEKAGYSKRAISTPTGVIIPDKKGGYIEYNDVKKQSRYVSPTEAIAEAHKNIMFGGLPIKQTKKENKTKKEHKTRELIKDIAINTLFGGSPIGFILSKIF